MSILIDENTKLIIQGITGREGAFHCERMLDYGTRVVGGVTPGKGGQTVCGVPVFNTVRDAVEQTGANASILFVPAAYTKAGLLEAVCAGVPLVVTIAEHVPVQDMLDVYHAARHMGVRVIGPNSFGLIAPNKCKVGFMEHSMFSSGHVALLSRSATNCYETVLMMTKAGMGQSICIGVGGDMIPGSTFVELLPLLQDDPDTKCIVLIGEIGGDEEEKAAAFIKAHLTKPVIAVIAGKNAPKGRSMGHAGAIVAADGTGSAQNKESALRDAGVIIAETTADIVRILGEMGG